MGERGPLKDNVVAIDRGAGATHRPAPASRPRPRPIRPVKPQWLDEYAARVWDRAIEELERLGMVNPTTRELLISYCQAASSNHAAYRALTPNKSRGPDVLTRGRSKSDMHRGVVNPAWRVVYQSAALLERLGKALVLPHPAALLRAEMPEVADEDESDLD
jgi:P27 family predicted phage terminase small subunit